MTEPNHPSGTDRCFECLQKTEGKYTYVINIQGDEPFIDPEQIDEIISACDGNAEIITQMIAADSHEVLFDMGEVKIVLNTNNEALYFSRMPIPFVKDVDEKKEVNPNDTENIKIALEDGWVITFPQGTTRSFKPVRKGTAHIILQHKPIVVPIVIDGFRRSFDRKGLLIKKKGILQSMVIKEPLQIDYETTSVDELVEMIEFAIEQHPSLLKVLPAEELEEKANLDKERMWRY
jgi:hypothetical protein